MKAAVTVKENYEFRRIYRKGKSLVSPQMVLYWQKNRQGQSRLGITVSTKLGHAVVRNRVRRRFRELYRLHKPEMQPGFDVILVARGRAVRSTYQQLDETYLRLLRQAGLVPEETARSGRFRSCSGSTRPPSPLFFRPGAAISPPARSMPWRRWRNTAPPRAAFWPCAV